MAPHSNTLAWKIPWTEEPGGLQSMGSRRVGHDWVTHFHFPLSCIGEGNGNPLQCSCLENPRDRGAWWAAIYGVAQSQTRLKQLSSSSSRGKNLSCYSRCMSLFALFCTQAELYKFPLFLCLFLFTGRDSFWNWVHTWRMKPSSLPAGLEFSYFQCNQDLSKA